MSAVSNRLTVHQHLVISSVCLVDEGLTVHVHDRSGRAQWIRFHLSQAQARGFVSRITDWRDRCTRLTYISGRGSGVLIDDEELFAAAFG